MAAIPPVCDFGWKAPGFELGATDGTVYSLDDLKGPNGLVVVFMCNHCPYVLAVLDRILRDAADLKDHGVGFVGINANDATMYPADSFENMTKIAKERDFPFPYLHDETQATARAYGAECTPDFFGFNSHLELQYRGRLDASRASAGPADLKRDLFDAMVEVAKTGLGPRDQIASMGCSIKWKAA